LRFGIVSTWPAPNFIPFLKILTEHDDVTCIFTKESEESIRRDAAAVLGKAVFTGPLNLRSGWSLAKQARREGWEAVVVNGPSTRSYAILAPILRLRRVPVVMWTQEWVGPVVSWKRKAATPVLRFLTSLATIVLAQGSRAAGLTASLGFPKARIRILRLGSELPSAGPTGGRSDGPILFVGRLLRVKGVHVLLQAVAQLAQRDVGARLVIVGDGPERPRLEEEAVRLGISSSVRFTGSVAPSELARYYDSSTMFVFPSIFDWDGQEQLEIWGYVLFEAAHFGLPLVTTDAAGAAPDLVVNGQDGFVVPWGDANSLAEAVRRILTDEELRNRLGKAAQQSAEEFSRQRAAERFRSALVDAARTEPQRSNLLPDRRDDRGFRLP
jgi:glycosyltransferase involved in cell wall biosynthesis